MLAWASAASTPARLLFAFWACQHLPSATRPLPFARAGAPAHASSSGVVTRQLDMSVPSSVAQEVLGMAAAGGGSKTPGKAPRPTAAAAAGPFSPPAAYGAVMARQPSPGSVAAPSPSGFGGGSSWAAVAAGHSEGGPGTPGAGRPTIGGNPAPAVRSSFYHGAPGGPLAQRAMSHQGLLGGAAAGAGPGAPFAAMPPATPDHATTSTGLLGTIGRMVSGAFVSAPPQVSEDMRLMPHRIAVLESRVTELDSALAARNRELSEAAKEGVALGRRIVSLNTEVTTMREELASKGEEMALLAVTLERARRDMAEAQRSHTAAAASAAANLAEASANLSRAERDRDAARAQVAEGLDTLGLNTAEYERQKAELTAKVRAACVCVCGHGCFLSWTSGAGGLLFAPAWLS